jgi:predicted RNA-binding protein (virulence factor B family)
MKIGEFNELRILRGSPYGLFLGDENQDVLLPKKECLPSMRVGDTIRVFLLTDSDDRLIATRRSPLASVGQFAKLRVVSVTRNGAFLDWGLDKDLFCPPKEQVDPMVEGRSYIVRVYLDEVSGRPVCSTRLNRFLKTEGWSLEVGQPVEILVVARGHEAITVIINGEVKGSLFPDEWHEELRVGDVRPAFVKAIRKEDGRVAVSLRPQGYERVMDARSRLLGALRAAGGSLPVSDRSSPEEIHRRFGLSKGAFKKLIGTLWKEGVIELEADRIRLR